MKYIPVFLNIHNCLYFPATIFLIFKSSNLIFSKKGIRVFESEGFEKIS